MTPIPDPPDREWNTHSAKAIEEYIGGIVGTIVADRDAEIAHLRSELKTAESQNRYLEARLAKEKERTITEALGQAA